MQVTVIKGTTRGWSGVSALALVTFLLSGVRLHGHDSGRLTGEGLSFAGEG